MQVGKIITAVGLTGLKSVCFSYYETRQGAQANIFISAPASTRQGLLKIFTPLSESAVPPAFVPVEATKFVRWRIDGEEAWKTLQDMLNNISPAAASGLNVAIDMANANAQQKDPSFDIRKNLFDNLGDDLIRYDKAPADPTVGASTAASLCLFSAHNTDRAVAVCHQHPQCPLSSSGAKGALNHGLFKATRSIRCPCRARACRDHPRWRRGTCIARAATVMWH